MTLQTAPSGSAFERALRAGLTALSVLLLAAYFVAVLLQVFYRYVLNDSIFWAEEFVRSTMIWGVMLASALVAAQRAHIRVELLESWLPPLGRRIVLQACDVLTLAFCAILVYAGWELVDRTWFQRSPMLDIPKWWVYVAIPVGAALEVLLMLLTWGRDTGPTDVPKDPTL
ncbi:MAG: TRAP transporter small permease [Burkholderiaceae bacterium]|jgi:TRAP-type C4-dicarboxylate transport system permease small subunit